MAAKKNQDHFDVLASWKMAFFAKTSLLCDDFRISYEIDMYILNDTHCINLKMHH